jgi:roadblock/LC7 domain-containing protein
MSLISELVALPGVVAAGEYSYRGDRFSYEGELNEDMARMASIMCRATTMAAHMQVDMFKELGEDCGCHPVRGWIVRGKEFSVCAVANVFCFVANSQGGINELLKEMLGKIDTKGTELV